MTTDLGRPIAYGRTAEIYAWRPGLVLKLFYDWFDPDAVERESRLARAIYASGLPVPAVGDLLQVNGRLGLVYQRLDGDTMLKELFGKPWRCLRLGRRMAELHAEMHANTTQADIPSQRKRLVRKIDQAESLPADLRSRALAVLEAMPDGDRLCHGDFHPGNILRTLQGDVIIDWIDASRGNPLADLARSTIIAMGAAETRQVPSLLSKAAVRILHAQYIRHYFRLRPGGEDEYRRWLPIVAAARLSEGIRELQEWLIARAEKGLSIEG